MEQYLTFALGERLYGVPALAVNSILDSQPWTALPPSGSLVVGLVNVRGNVVPLFDPRARLERTLGAVSTDSWRTDAGNVVLDTSVGGQTEGGILVFELPNGTNLPFVGLEVDRIVGVTLLTP